MTVSERKTTVWIPLFYHKKLKILSTENETTIEEELLKILSKKFPVKEE